MLLQGLRDHLPARAKRLNQFEQLVLGLFESSGYQYIITPLLEKLDVLGLALGSTDRMQSDKQLFRTIDPHRGELVAVRPDFLPQIARLVATRLTDWPKPIRLCYSGRVIRADQVDHESGGSQGANAQGVSREIFQVGAELMGEKAVWADVEMITLTTALLKRLGIQSFKLDLGLPSFARMLLDPVKEQVSEEIWRTFLSALKERQLKAVELLPKNAFAHSKTRDLVASLAGLTGTPQEVFRELKSFKIPKDCQGALDQMSACIQGLEEVIEDFDSRIILDLGEVSGFDYYSGVTFQAYMKGVGKPLVSGGRYDDLLARFGRSLPAIGFAADLEVILAALAKEQGVGEDLTASMKQPGLVWATAAEGAEAGAGQGVKAMGAGYQNEIAALHDLGVRVSFLEGDRQMAAAFAAHYGFDWIYFEDADRTSGAWIDVATGNEERLTPRKLLGEIKKQCPMSS